MNPITEIERELEEARKVRCPACGYSVDAAHAECPHCGADLSKVNKKKVEEGALTAKGRKQIDPGSFALPGRRYPIHDLAHARNALARVAQHGSEEEKKKVRSAVYRKYPGLRKRVEEASVRGAAREVVQEIKRLADGTFAPKGLGRVLRAGDRVRIPRGQRRHEMTGRVLGPAPSGDSVRVAITGAGTINVRRVSYGKGDTVSVSGRGLAKVVEDRGDKVKVRKMVAAPGGKAKEVTVVEPKGAVDPYEGPTEGTGSLRGLSDEKADPGDLGSMSEQELRGALSRAMAKPLPPGGTTARAAGEIEGGHRARIEAIRAELKRRGEWREPSGEKADPGDLDGEHYPVKPSEFGGYRLSYFGSDGQMHLAAVAGGGGVGSGVLSRLPESLRPDRGDGYSYSTREKAQAASAALEGMRGEKLDPGIDRSERLKSKVFSRLAQADPEYRRLQREAMSAPAGSDEQRARHQMLDQYVKDAGLIDKAVAGVEGEKLDPGDRPKPGGWTKIVTRPEARFQREIAVTVSKREFEFHPSLMDRTLDIEPGRRVRIAKLHGTPPPGTMGQYHIADAETGEFLGMVTYGSLRTPGEKADPGTRPFGGKRYALVQDIGGGKKVTAGTSDDPEVLKRERAKWAASDSLSIVDQDNFTPEEVAGAYDRRGDLLDPGIDPARRAVTPATRPLSQEELARRARGTVGQPATGTAEKGDPGSMTPEQSAAITKLKADAAEAGASVSVEPAGAFTPGVVAVVATRPDGLRVSSLVGPNGGATPWDRHDAPGTEKADPGDLRAQSDEEFADYLDMVGRDYGESGSTETAKDYALMAQVTRDMSDPDAQTRDMLRRVAADYRESGREATAEDYEEFLKRLDTPQRRSLRHTLRTAKDIPPGWKALVDEHGIEYATDLLMQREGEKADPGATGPVEAGTRVWVKDADGKMHVGEVVGGPANETLVTLQRDDGSVVHLGPGIQKISPVDARVGGVQRALRGDTEPDKGVFGNELAERTGLSLQDLRELESEGHLVSVHVFGQRYPDSMGGGEVPKGGAYRYRLPNTQDVLLQRDMERLHGNRTASSRLTNMARAWGMAYDPELGDTAEKADPAMDMAYGIGVARRERPEAPRPRPLSQAEMAARARSTVGQPATGTAERGDPGTGGVERKIITRDMPNGDRIEVRAERREGDPSGLSDAFSVTVAGWEKRGTHSGAVRQRMDRDWDFGGADHESALRAAPQLAPLIRMHLANPNTGEPMHAEENGWYFYTGKAREHEDRTYGPDYAKRSGTDRERAARALRVDDPADLPEGMDREEFHEFVEAQRPRWKQEADEATRLLRSLSGDEKADPGSGLVARYPEGRAGTHQRPGPDEVTAPLSIDAMRARNARIRERFNVIGPLGAGGKAEKLDPGFDAAAEARTRQGGMAWEYEDARGVKHVGFVESTSDRGGTDVTYFFRDAMTGELTVRSNLAHTDDARSLNMTVGDARRKYATGVQPLGTPLMERMVRASTSRLKSIARDAGSTPEARDMARRILRERGVTS